MATKGLMGKGTQVEPNRISRWLKPQLKRKRQCGFITNNQWLRIEGVRMARVQNRDFKIYANQTGQYAIFYDDPDQLINPKYLCLVSINPYGCVDAIFEKAVQLWRQRNEKRAEA